MKKVFLIAPSKHCTKTNVKNALRTLSMMNLSGKHLKSITEKMFFFAGTPQRRAKELHQAYKDTESDYIFSMKGGKGAVQFLDLIDFSLISKNKKPLVGYSDITILLNTISQKTSSPCIHGPTLSKKFEDYDEKTKEYWFKALNREGYSITFPKKSIIKPGKAKGRIVGGNLMLLTRSLGTKHEINTEGAIIFIEQNAYSERMFFDTLSQLKSAGKFDTAQGIILGHFTRTGSKTKDYLETFFADFNIPVIYKQPFGHSLPNISFPIGEECTLDTEEGFWSVEYS